MANPGASPNGAAAGIYGPTGALAEPGVFLQRVSDVTCNAGAVTLLGMDPGNLQFPNEGNWYLWCDFNFSVSSVNGTNWQLQFGTVIVGPFFLLAAGQSFMPWSGRYLVAQGSPHTTLPTGNADTRINNQGANSMLVKTGSNVHYYMTRSDATP